MLTYVVGNTAFVAVNYIWFFFFLSNLLSYHFVVRSLKSLHVWTFLLAQVLVVGQLLIFQRIEVEFSILSTCNSCFCRFNDFWLGSDSYCGGFERSSQAKTKYPDKSIVSRKRAQSYRSRICMIVWGIPLLCLVSRQI